MNQPAISVREIETVFSGRKVHSGISFDVKRNKVTALIAASGGGKSVLLREILALSQPTAGQIILLGTNVTLANYATLQSLRNRIGVLFQNGALFSGLSVSENIAVPLVEHTNLKEEEVEEIVDLRLALVGLSKEVGKLKPSELSGGMRKRVALARALSLEPDILFLDEPTSGLDPISSREFDELIKVLNQGLNLTVFMITHDPESLWAICDEVVALADGKLIGQGSVSEVSHIDHPWLQKYFSKVKGYQNG